MTNQTTLTKDLANKKIIVTREFVASRDLVWDAWTKSDLLEQWWGPQPRKAVTQKMDFKEGGSWFYYMSGPKGEKMYSKFEFEAIDPKNSFSGKDCFCDENGKESSDMPSDRWTSTFTATPNGTKVTVELQFKSEADLQKLIDTGFEEGFSIGHKQLDELLKKQEEHAV